MLEARPVDAREIRKDAAIVGAALALYLPCLFFGYGSDNDSYGVLDVARLLWTHFQYARSRNPGFLVFEASVAALSALGGSLACNAVTMLFALATIWFFLRICARHEVPHRRWLAAGFATAPVFWVNATCTMDYVWALGFLLAGLWLLESGRSVAAAIPWGLAIGTRISSFVAVGAFLLYGLATRPGDRRNVVLAGALVAILAAACYVPSFRQANYTLAFLTPGTPSEYWSLGLRIGRFGYKNLYFWGLPAATFLLGMLPRVVGRLAHAIRVGEPRPALVWMSAGIVLAYELFFLKFPIETAYLLPLLPFALILLGISLRDRPVALKAFIVAVASYAFVSFNVARPDAQNWARTASIGLWVEPGYVLSDLRARWRLRTCDSQDCWRSISPASSPPSR